MAICRSRRLTLSIYLNHTRTHDPRPPTHTMKTHALILAAFAAFTLPTWADSSASILTDYRAKAETALSKVNATLDTEAAKISRTLLSLNATDAVADLAAQVQAKRAGEPVANPVPQAVQLFAAYDRARAAALAPVQESSLRRIETLLASSEGRKTEVVAELAKLKTDVLAGRQPPEPPKVPVEWTYHTTEDSTALGSLLLRPDGTFELNVPRSTITFSVVSNAGRARPQPVVELAAGACCLQIVGQKVPGQNRRRVGRTRYQIRPFKQIRQPRGVLVAL